MQELIIPPEAETAEVALEIARGWIIDGRLVCSLQPGIWKEQPETWGILLADMLQHICNALTDVTDLSRDQLRRIVTKRLLDELHDPTAEHTGGFVDEEE